MEAFRAVVERELHDTDPPLTTIRQPVQAITTAAVRALGTRTPSTGSERAAHVDTPDLVVRGSTGPAPTKARDPAVF
ncbi:MAG: substrate-binding domain-containing protein [Actinomyces sp.]|nr:substrate-binding domain-containing protein [Actinomyces sp.]